MGLHMAPTSVNQQLCDTLPTLSYRLHGEPACAQMQSHNGLRFRLALRNRFCTRHSILCLRFITLQNWPLRMRPEGSLALCLSLC